MNSAALSDRLLVGPAGLLRLNTVLGTCRPVDGLHTYGQPARADGEGIHFHVDPVALLASADEPAPASDSLLVLAPLAVRVMRANWLLLGLVGLLAVAACTKRNEASAPERTPLTRLT